MKKESRVILSKTDTTIGFLSQDKSSLDRVKNRASNKYYIKVIASLKSLKQYARVPKKHKKYLRRAKKTTFIFPNQHSYRIIYDKSHRLLLERYDWLYSTSANLSGKDIDIDFAKSKADIIIYPIDSYGTSSKIIKLGKSKKRRIR